MFDILLPVDTAIQVVDLSVFLLSIGLAIQGFEDIVLRCSFNKSALLSWRIERTDFCSDSIVQRILDFFFSPIRFSFFLGFRLVISLTCILMFVFGNSIHPVLVILLFACTMLFGFRSRHGLDGSHHMFLVVLLPCAIAKSVDADSTVVTVCVMYIAAQLTLSYFISGVTKIRGNRWRDGTAFAGIFSTDAYGSPMLFRLSEQLPICGLLICWCIIIFETLFPIVFFLPDYGQIGVLGIGVMFHLVIAIFMGLNKFIWAWWSAYPSLGWMLTKL